MQKFEAQAKAEASRASALALAPFCELLFYDANLCIDCCNRHSLYFCSFPYPWLYEVYQSVQVCFPGFQGVRIADFALCSSAHGGASWMTETALLQSRLGGKLRYIASTSSKLC